MNRQRGKLWSWYRREAVRNPFGAEMWLEIHLMKKSLRQNISRMFIHGEGNEMLGLDQFLSK